MSGDVTKLSELHAFLADFPISKTSAKAIGCKHEVIVVTSSVEREFPYTTFERTVRNNRHCGAKDVVNTHYEQIVEELAAHEGLTMHVRVMPELVDILDEDGEFTGQYYMRSRLQFGEPGKFITFEQYENLVELGWEPHPCKST